LTPYVPGTPILPHSLLNLTHPRTYLGFLRLNKALTSWRSANSNSPVTFTLTLAPYQLYPDFSTTGVSKYEWYKSEKYNDSDERMKMYVDYMTALGRDEGVEFEFGKEGVIANTLNAHRVLHVLQNEYSPDHALKVLSELYQQYFSQSAHPSKKETLMKACIAAGLSEDNAKALVEDEDKGLRETKAAIREQVGNAVDSVPYVVFEGRKRDFTEIGAKTVAEYTKVLAQVAKEAS
jgi:predicted DsbA family dithiol-disulfide isomerase